MLGAGHSSGVASSLWGEGTYTYASMPGTLAGEVGVPFVAAALVRASGDIARSARYLWGNSDQPNDKGWALIVDDQGRVGAYVSGTFMGPGSTAVPESLWQLAVLAHDPILIGDNTFLYVNGVKVAEDNITFAPASGIPARVGGDRVAGSNFQSLGKALVAGVGFESGERALSLGAEGSVQDQYNGVQRQQQFAAQYLNGMITGTLEGKFISNVFNYANQYNAFGLQGTNRTTGGLNISSLTGGARDTWVREPVRNVLDPADNLVEPVETDLTLESDAGQRPFLVDDPNPQWSQIVPEFS